MSVIKAEALMKIYTQGQDKIYAVNNVSLCIEKGEFAAIIGQSGSGKTTLLNLLGGIEAPTSGNVWIDGISLIGTSESRIAQIKRQKIGHIFQDFSLIPILTARDNISMPVLLDGKKVNQKELESLASFLGIDNRLNHFPSELSGGQRQRVAIARALINHPSIILADEPTGNLDKHSADEIMNLLLDINQAGNTILLVTHELRYADMCQRKIEISDGRIVHDSKKG